MTTTDENVILTYSSNEVEYLFRVIQKLCFELATEIDIHYELKDAHVVKDGVDALAYASQALSIHGKTPHDVATHVINRLSLHPYKQPE
jgi:DNA-binding transcriptional regulator LsrR (DeoR family)